jgi:hypothetical protein
MYARQDYVHCSGASRGHRKCAKAAEAYANIIGMVKSDRNALSAIEWRLIRAER